MDINLEYKKTQVNKVNQGTYFKLRPTETAPVWVRGEYDKASKLILAISTMITNHEKFLKGNREIYINFTF